MISEIAISNYKSILYQRFTLGRLNVFVGREGSGKTNILEALGIAAAAHDETLDSDNLIKRGIKAEKPSLMFHSTTDNSVQNNEIEIVWYERNSWKKSKLVSDNPDELDAKWKDISWYEPEYIDKINNLIRFISDGSIEGEYPFADESKNVVLNAAFRGSRNFRNYNIYNVNSGDIKDCQDIYSFFQSLFTDRNTPSIFAIDGIETMLPMDVCCNMMTNVAQLAVRQNKQALITTNSPSMVKGMDLSDPAQKLYFVKMSENCQTVIKELKDISLVEILWNEVN